MGFFDNLIKKEGRKILARVADTILDNVNDALKQGNTASAQTAPTHTSTPAQSAVRQTTSDYAPVTQKLEEIIAAEWADYELRKEVPASVFGAEAGARNYSYGLYRDGQPKAMIMILNNHNAYRHSTVRKAQLACRQNEIPYMNFMSYFSNHRDYISKRLKETVLS